MRPKLSILIPTLPARIECYSNLIRELSAQIKRERAERDIELISLMDSKLMSVGEKRNELIRMSKGEYVCFVDCDDTLSRDYIKLILGGIKYKKDVVTFCGEYHVSGKKDSDFKISLTCKSDYNENGCHYRLPNHLCAVKRAIATQCKFPDKNFGEDSEYSALINRMINNEYHIIEKIYNYNYDPATSQTVPGNNASIY